MVTSDPDFDICVAAILAARPDLSDARFTAIDAGWDSLAIDADDRWIFKFPRDPEGEDALRREAALLDVLGPRLTMKVSAPSIIDGPPLFSAHEKIPGEHLLMSDYALLDEAARDALAQAMAQFHAEVHALSELSINAAGDTPVEPWAPADAMREAGVPALPMHLRDIATASIDAYETLGPDPLGKVLGYFDGHGWNMAFDHDAQRLNGLYDFADAGVGDLHEEFAYASFIDPDLTGRIIAHYEAITGRHIDRRRVAVLTSMVHMSDLAEYAEEPGMLAKVLDYAVAWFEGDWAKGIKA